MYEDVKVLVDVVIVASIALIIGEELDVAIWAVDDEVYVISLSIVYDTVSESVDMLAAVLVFVQVVAKSVVEKEVSGFGVVATVLT